MLIRRCLLSFGLVILFGGIEPIVSGDRPYNCSTGDAFIIGVMISALVYGLPNMIFLLLLYFTKIGKEFLLKIGFLILEIFLLFLSGYITGKIVDELVVHLPFQYVFYKTPTEEGRKFYFADGFQFMYTFALLLILLLVVKKIFIKQERVSE